MKKSLNVYTLLPLVEQVRQELLDGQIHSPAGKKYIFCPCGMDEAGHFAYGSYVLAVLRQGMSTQEWESFVYMCTFYGRSTNADGQDLPAALITASSWLFPDNSGDQVLFEYAMLDLLYEFALQKFGSDSMYSQQFLPQKPASPLVN